MTSGTLESESHGKLLKTVKHMLKAQTVTGLCSQVTFMFLAQGHTLRTTATEVESLNESLQDLYFVHSFLGCVSNLFPDCKCF